MAKGVNAADAHRKQLRAKEKKKNKQERVKARELGDVKKDTRCGCLVPALLLQVFLVMLVSPTPVLSTRPKPSRTRCASSLSRVSWS